ncbi:MAG: putative toxin-antitoxin system toxin component, PIN family [Coriobacteriales bacterium]|nr:putative toxin-antitoxin system toxin component, PIN family [Coriobacteriales bacterium]
MAARVVFDTNVFVSAYAFGGKPADLMRAAIQGRIDLVTSPELLAELARVLTDKLDFDAEHVEAVLLQIVRVAAVLRPEVTLDVVDDDPDNRVLECAVACDAAMIVSGDRHLLDLGSHEDIAIVTPASMVRHLADAL